MNYSPHVLQPHSAVPMVWNAFPCFDLVDTRFGDHTGAPRVFDRLEMPGWQEAFLAHWGWRAPVPAGAEELELLRELRGRVRRFLEEAAAGREAGSDELAYFKRLLEAAPFVYTIGPERTLETVPAVGGWNWAVAGIVSSAFQVATTQDVRRIKKCANPDCTWLFFDDSLNRSRRWCQSRFCGNLAHVRRHRERTRPAT